MVFVVWFVWVLGFWFARCGFCVICCEFLLAELVVVCYFGGFLVALGLGA